MHDKGQLAAGRSLTHNGQTIHQRSSGGSLQNGCSCVCLFSCHHAGRRNRVRLASQSSASPKDGRRTGSFCKGKNGLVKKRTLPVIRTGFAQFVRLYIKKKSLATKEN